MNNQVTLEACAVTHPGLRRRVNEDSFFCDPETGLFVVADGMGGESCGDAASRITTDSFVELLMPHLTDEEATAAFENASRDDFILNAMAHAADMANQSVSEYAGANPECRGMGSTLTAAAVHAGELHILHVGDSRMYQYAGGNLQQLTEDHTRVHEMVMKNIITQDEAGTHHLRHVITRCIGRKKSMHPDLIKMEFQLDALYLLCSDGLYDMVPKNELAQTFGQFENIHTTGDRLITLANEKGGADNITIILFRQSEADTEERQL